MQCDPLEFKCHVEQRIVLDSDFAQHFVAGLLHDLGARVVMLVDPVAEAHQAEAIVLSLARRMYSGMRSGLPISRSMFSAASLAPPWAGPHRHAQPAAMQAKGLAPEEPASLTVEVEAFCSWSACKMKMRSIARASTALGL